MLRLVCNGLLCGMVLVICVMLFMMCCGPLVVGCVLVVCSLLSDVVSLWFVLYGWLLVLGVWLCVVDCC